MGLQDRPGHRGFHASMLDDLGDREGACPDGWPHPWDPDNCELDSVVEEDETQEPETHTETREHLRDQAHRHLAVPSKWDVKRAAAAAAKAAAPEGGK